MKLPRDLTGQPLAKALTKLGYKVVRACCLGYLGRALRPWNNG